MKMCQRHWGKLREGIDARGLSHLVAKNGHIAMQNMVLELEGRGREAMFDPLMAVHNRIVQVVLGRIGLALMEGDKCPVCEGIKTNEGVVDPEKGHVYTAEEEESYWIDGPLDSVKEFCVSKGWA